MTRYLTLPNLSLMAVLAIALVTGLSLLNPVVAESDEATIQRLAKLLDVEAVNIRPAPVPGMFEVSSGGAIGYATADGKYFLEGDLIDVASMTNLTEQRRGGMRTRMLNELGEENMIVFAPKNVKHTVTVFTDIDCGYCRRLHQQMDDYHANGIAVRYVFYPRSGPNTPSFAKAESVWCADDQQQAMTKAKALIKLPPPNCKTPVEKHYETGINIGLRGTPAIITSSGRIIPGYVEAARLREVLESEG